MAAPIVHAEIIGSDPARLRAFYAELFGWAPDTDSPVASTVSEAGQYGFVTPSDESEAVPAGVGGGAGFAPAVLFYVGVPEVREALDRAVGLGASVALEPIARPDGALVVARFRDPEGNLVGLAGPR